MAIRPLPPTVVESDEALKRFLGTNTLSHLHRLPALSAPSIQLHKIIGTGAEGMVIECSIPTLPGRNCIKLFFLNETPQELGQIWPLKREARYYAACLHHKTRFEDQKESLPQIPLDFLKSWQSCEVELPSTQILADIKGCSRQSLSTSTQEQSYDIISRMSIAHGWLSFEISSLYPSLRRLDPWMGFEFTGKRVIGIVKTLVPNGECNLNKRYEVMWMQNMLGFALWNYEPRNWVGDVLVDGADAERSRYTDRHWRFLSIAFQDLFHSLRFEESASRPFTVGSHSSRRAGEQAHREEDSG